MALARSSGLAIKFSEVESGKPELKDIQLLKTGTFHTDKYGKFQITSKLLHEMVDNFVKGIRGIVPALDYAHETDGPAAGWIRELKVVKDGNEEQLWGKVETTPRGLKSLAEKEYAYISADFDESYVDNESNKNCGCVLLGAALTNRPVVKRMRPAVQLSETCLDEFDPAMQKKISDKIALLVSEGKDQEQATAIAYSMAREGKLSEENKMDPKEMEKKLGEYKKALADMGYESEEAMMKDIAEGKLKKPAAEAKKEEPAVGQQLGEDLKKELSETKRKLVEAEEKIVKAAKENDFNKMLAEGKVVEAQRDPYMANDMKKFSELSAPMNKDGKGTSEMPSKDSVEEDVEDVIQAKAKALSEEKKISMKDAIVEVLKSDKKLSEKYAAKNG